MTNSQVALCELRQTSKFQADVIRKYAGFMRWMDTAIDDYEKKIEEHNRDESSGHTWVKSKMVEEIELEAFKVRLEITKMFEKKDGDDKQTNIIP